MHDLATRLAALPPEARRLLELQLGAERREVARGPVRRGLARAPLSFAQRRLWFLELLELGPLYNAPIVLRLQGDLDADVLERALAEIVRRHESLRTVFRLGAAGEPEQVILPPGGFRLEIDDLTESEDPRGEAEAIVRVEVRRPFDLAAGPLFRARLLRTAGGEWRLVLAMHHTVSDGWSLGVLFRELAALYEAFARGEPSPLPELPLQYADYAAWQHEELTDARVAAQLEWWRKALQGAPALLELPTDRPRPPEQSHRGARLRIALPRALAEAAGELARREGATTFMVLLAAFQVLLHRWSGAADVVVGSPIAGRTRGELEGLIGFFANTVALRADLSDDPGFGELLARVRETTLGAYQHQELPFDRLVEALHPERSLGHAPVFQAMLALQNAAAAELRLPNVRAEILPAPTGAARFDLEWFLWHRADGIDGTIHYAADLFDAATIERMAAHFRRLLEAAVARPETWVSALPLLGPEERRALLAWGEGADKGTGDRGQGTASTATAPGACVHRLFEAQVAQTPDAAALIDGSERISYRELNGRANHLARHLRALGVGPESRVGVHLERGAGLAVALLGVLKAGGAYVPLDPAYPAARLAFMLGDTGASVVITSAALRASLPATDACVIVSGDAIDKVDDDSGDVDGGAEPGNLAYLTHTSGSTGTPKGVALEHRGVSALMRWAGDAFSDDEMAGVLATTSVGFDVSVFELFAPLVRGGTVILAADALAVADLPARGAATLLSTVPSAAAELVRAGAIPPSVRTVCVAGEALPRALVDALHATPTISRVCNAYGPSEDTVFSTVADVPAGDAVVTIGRPIAGGRAYVLDARLDPVPIGIAGDLYLGGEGLARGYLGRAGATAERFIPDPLGEAGARMYRTGDRARWTAEGEIVFLGRVDAQVKVRGFRVEPGEVEAALARHPSVAAAAVAARGEGRLVAWIVPAAGEMDAAELRTHLRAHLPDFMVPRTFVAIGRLPLTASGKIDRRALPEPDAPASPEVFVAPRTETEATLARLWAEVLGLPSVGVDDDFFELGGHSLLAARVAARASAALGAELPLRALFEAPTVAALAARLRAADALPPLPPIERAPEGAAPLSFAQEGLWAAHRLEGGGPAYHMPAAWRIRGDVDADALARAFAELVARHEPLRTAIRGQGTGDRGQPAGAPVQVVLSASPFDLPVDDLAAAADPEAEARRIAADEAARPFDLERGATPAGSSHGVRGSHGETMALRARLLRLGDGDFVLSLVVHHVAADGWSLGVLFRELGALYAAFARGEPSPLPPLPVRYADFAAWQRAWLSGDAMDAQLAYWRERLAGAPPALDLPTDRPRPAVRSPAGAHHPFALPAEAVARLGALARGEGATLFMALAAGFAAVLARWSGDEEVVIGTPVANRRRPELEGLAGCFVNTLPLRTDMAGDPSFRALLGRLREATLGAFTHPDVPFHRIVEALRVERSSARHPVFQAMLALQNTPPGDLSLAGAKVERFRSLPPTSPFELSISLAPEGDGGLRGVLEYATDLFHADTAERIARHFARLLEAAAADADAPVSALPLMDAAERRQLLFDWNAATPAYPRDATIPALFAEVVAAMPDAPAIVGDGDPITYAELDARSDALARKLAAAGVRPGARVAIALERSAQGVVAMLAALKAGAAYVPIDPTHPAERLRTILDDCAAAALVVAGDAEPIAGYAGPVIAVTASDDDDATQAVPPVPSALEAESAAYVIYTSGSTGTPKGVEVPHRALVRLCRGGGWLALGPADGVLHLAAPTFDVAALEVWAALLNGARVIVVPGRAPSLAEIGAAMREHAATVFVPSVGIMNALVDERPEDLRGLRYLEGGGEALSVPHVRRALERLPGVAIANGYGPTENGVVTTRRFVTAADVERPGIPIGEPIAGTRVYVLDAALRPVPVGIPGELCAAGDGVAIGYVGRPELTAERFVTVDLGDGLVERVCRTGDRARWLPEGTLEFLGRLDEQVKVRGFRVEPGEVEAALVRHPRVSAAAVGAMGDRAGDRRLVAWVAGRDGPAPDEAELRAFLARSLPDYLVPAAFVAVPALPYTSAGKVDRRALPAPEPARRAQAAVVPRTALERRIAAIWADLLRVDSVGVEESFFELGGNSLLLIALHERLSREIGGQARPLVELFDHPTVRAQASWLGGASPSPETHGDNERAAMPSTDNHGDRGRAAMPSTDNRIAIIGMAGRFPGAADVEAFWRNLRNGVESITRFSRQELEDAGYPARWLDDPRFVPAMGPIEGTEWFDAGFFGYSPRDAEIIDPQQRLFLEACWEAMENAGYAPGGRVGVFAGQSASAYEDRLRANEAVMRAVGPFSVILSNEKDFLCSRVAYKLGLEGPAVSVQTACSTSLVAIHMACRALLAGECEMALAGGSATAVPTRGGYLYEEGGIASPDGHVRAFDARGKGAVGGSGVAAVLLKRLGDALADGDSIHAVILGSAINNDGALKVGFTAPRVDGQAAAIRGALAAAGVSPSTVTYVETHGTATELGDPIEVAALTEAFATPERGYCGIGSVKTNVGHLDAAAGVAGLIKTVMALRHREIPPSLHFTEPNPKIDFARSPFYVNAALRPWARRNGTRLRAGVSSFGMGGTNAHAVLEEAPEPPPPAPSRPWQLLALSARTPSALEAATDRLAAHLRDHPDLPLADVAFTLREGRRAFAHRRTLVVREGEDVAKLLAERAPGRLADGAAAERPSIAFLFPGLGDPYPGMGRGLYDAEPVYRAEVDRCAALLRPHLGFDLRDVLYPPDAPSPNGAGDGKPDLRKMLGRVAPDPAAERLNRTEAAHPAVFVTGWALAKLWEHRGIRPEALIGHSLGEYVAACVAGVFTLADALELVAARAKWIQALPGGAMLAVSLSPEQARPFLTADVTIAAVNAPETCVVAGPAEAVDAVRARVAEAGAVARILPTTHAFHTPMMAPVAERLAGLLARMELRPPSIPLLSNVTGGWLTDQQARDPGYWARHLCETVRFDAGVDELLAEPGRVLLEVGPGQTLGTFVRQRPRDASRPVPPIVASLRHAYEPASDEAVHLAALGRLWSAGVRVDWPSLRQGERRRRVPLPTYPFERARLWVEAAAPRQAASPDTPASTEPTKEPEIRDWFHVQSWRRTLAPPPAAAPEERRSWLVLADENGVGEAIAARLWEMGQGVAIARAGEGFARTAEGWTVRPGEPDDLRALLAALSGDGRPPDHVLHLWALPTAPDEAPDAALVRWGERGWHSLRALAAALDAEGGERPVRIVVAASETAVVESGDRIVPEKAMLLGALKVMGQEDARLACRSVDAGAAEPGTPAWERRTDRILAEILSPAEEAAAAWRGGLRFAQAWEPAPIEKGAPHTRRPQNHGVYLVTGGLGRVGMLIAGWLARLAGARLVLTRRTPFPPRAEWDAWLAAHPADDETGRRILAIRQMEAAGAEVTIHTVDVADEAAMRRVIEDARLRFGRLDGVIHAAGVVGGPSLDRRLATLSREDAEAQFRAKVVGARVLERVVPPEADVVLLVSSMSAVLGGFGFGAYAAANAYLDALAVSRDGRRGTAWLAAGWDGWPAVVSPDEDDTARSHLGLSMTVSEAVEAFRRTWTCATVPHLAVAVGGLQQRLERWVTARAPEPIAPTGDDGDTPRSPRALLGIEEPYVEPRTALERDLEQLWGQLLGVEAIGVHDDFFRLGGHSLLGTRLVGRVRQEMGVELPIQALFRAPTIARMAAEIDELRLREADPALLAGLLDDIRALTPEQVAALLAAPDDEPAGTPEGT